jgi:hypothetical protein
MRRLVVPLLSTLMILLWTPARAQDPPSSGIDPQTLRRPFATWNQAEREFDAERRLVVAINSAWPDTEFTKESIAARTALLNAIRAAIDSESRSAQAK